MDTKIFLDGYVRFYATTCCIACGGELTGNISFYAEVYHEDCARTAHIFSCALCGLAYAYPFVGEKDQDALYRKVYADQYLYRDTTAPTALRRLSDAVNGKVFGHMLHGKSIRLKKIITSFIFQRLWQTYPLLTHQDGNAVISILDFGCGDGTFLVLAKKHGCDVYGVEIDDSERVKLLRNQGLTVVRSIDEYACMAGRFDVVRINHVLEHLIDPHALLDKIDVALKQGGELIVGTPNFNTPAKIFKKHYNLNLPYHRYFFTKKSIKCLLERHGFKIAYYKTKSTGIFTMSMFRKYRNQNILRVMRVIDICASMIVDVFAMGDCMEIHCRKDMKA